MFNRSTSVGLRSHAIKILTPKINYGETFLNEIFWRGSREELRKSPVSLMFCQWEQLGVKWGGELSSPAQLGVWWNYAGGCTVTSGQAGSCHSHFTLNNRALNTEHRYVHTKTVTKGVADVDTDDDVDVYAITWTQSDWTVDTSPWGNTFSTQYLIFVTDQFPGQWTCHDQTTEWWTLSQPQPCRSLSWSRHSQGIQ